MDLTAVLVVALVFGLPIFAIVSITRMLVRYRLESRALEVRRLEASAALLQHTADLPEWIDASDPKAIADWRKAQQELDRISALAATQRSLLGST